MTFEKWRINIEDVGPSLYKYYTNFLCLLGCISFLLKLALPPFLDNEINTWTDSIMWERSTIDSQRYFLYWSSVVSLHFPESPVPHQPSPPHPRPSPPLPLFYTATMQTSFPNDFFSIFYNGISLKRKRPLFPIPYKQINVSTPPPRLSGSALLFPSIIYFASKIYTNHIKFYTHLK